MKHLVILTKQFPYQWREQYVAHELKALTRHFDRVFIYPHDHYKKEDAIRFELPAGVEVIDLNQHFVPVGKSRIILPFLVAFFVEWMCSKRKWYQVKSWRRFYSIYATQCALGNGLMRWQKSREINSSDVVYYSYWMSASALCLSLLKRRGEIPGFVSRAHSVDLYHEDWGLLRDMHSVPPFRCLKEHEVSIVYPISKHGFMHLSHRGVPKTKLKLHYLGVVDAGLGPRPTDGVFTIVTCSGIDDNKRIHLLGKALSRQKNAVRWVHFGDGPLRDLAIQSITSPLVKFECRGQTSNEEIRAFYSDNAVHCFANLSIVEGLPVSIMEAMSHGIPVLATAVYGVPEIVLDGYNGVTLPAQFSDHEVDEALKLFMTHADATELWRRNARSHFEQYFDADANYELFASEISTIKL